MNTPPIRYKNEAKEKPNFPGLAITPLIDIIIVVPNNIKVNKNISIGTKNKSRPAKKVFIECAIATNNIPLSSFR